MCDTVYVSADRFQHGAIDWEVPSPGDVGHQPLLHTHGGHLAQHHTGRGRGRRMLDGERYNRGTM